MKSTPPTSTAFCNYCGGDRNHFILHSAISHWYDQDDEPAGHDIYETLKCAGCDSIKLVHTTSEPWPGTDGKTYFPPKTLRKRPRWYDALIDHEAAEAISIAEILNEVYVGIQNGLLRSPALATRAMLELIMIEKVGDCGSFQRNIDAFAAQGFISIIQKTRFEAVLEVGHAAMHRNYIPSREDLLAVLDIAEHLIESLYIHDQQAEKLQVSIPARKRKT